MRLCLSNIPTRHFNVSFEGTTWMTISADDEEAIGLEGLLASMATEKERLNWKTKWTTDTDKTSKSSASVLNNAAPPYSRCRKILGIGLNYRAHADDLGANYPTSPASFFKGDHTIIGPNENIVLPEISKRVTSEAELGLVIGLPCYKVSEKEALRYVAGICPILDQTAEDILQENPRFLTRAKNFPTFFSFGPELVSLDEAGELAELTVATYHNGSLVRSNIVRNMLFSPQYLVAFHSQVMPLYPGDIISTGTPGAVVIQSNDTVECRIDGLATLTNSVVGPN